MKRTVVLLAFASLLFAACTQNQATANHPASTDTVKTVAKYVVGYEVRESFVFKVVKDTFSFAPVDSTSEKVTQEKKWTKTTQYYIPMLDTVRINGTPVLDSLHKPKFEVRFFPIDKKFILIDYDKRF